MGGVCILFVSRNDRMATACFLNKKDFETGNMQDNRFCLFATSKFSLLQRAYRFFCAQENRINILFPMKKENSVPRVKPVGGGITACDHEEGGS